jgi:glutamate decarboxylase
MPTFALNFSRPGGQIICQYYNFLRLGHEGYFKVQRACADAALFFAERLKKYGIFEIISDGDQGVPGVCWKLREPEKHPFTLYDLAEKLRYTGWLVPAYSLPADCENIVIQRILVRHGVTIDLLDKLDKDIARALQTLDGKSCPVGANTAFHH